MSVSALLNETFRPLMGYEAMKELREAAAHDKRWNLGSAGVPTSNSIDTASVANVYLCQSISDFVDISRLSTMPLGVFGISGFADVILMSTGATAVPRGYRPSPK